MKPVVQPFNKKSITRKVGLGLVIPDVFVYLSPKKLDFNFVEVLA